MKPFCLWGCSKISILSRLYVLSDQFPVDNYVPMHSSTTSGQKEDNTLLTFTSDGSEGEKHTNTKRCEEWTHLTVTLLLFFLFFYTDPEIDETEDDEAEDLQTLTFDDLLCFALQVAKGMEFLSSKNVWTSLGLKTPPPL